MPGQGGGGSCAGAGQGADTPGSGTGPGLYTEQKWNVLVRQAAAVAAKQAGRMPGYAQLAIDNLNPGKTDWRETLREFIDPSSRIDYSWSKPDRRFSGERWMLPGTVSDGVHHVVIAIDTSGSIDKDLLTTFVSELQGLMDQAVVDRVTVLTCDDALHGVHEFQAGDVIEFAPKGGGGTGYEPVWKWVADSCEDFTAIVYFTDLDVYDGHGEEPRVPVLWAAYNASEHDIARVPFGEVIEIEEDR